MYATLPPAQPWLIEVPTRAITKTVRQEWQEFTSDCEAEKGLILASTASKILRVSTQRVYELISLGKLTKFQHLGHSWVSCSELMHRLSAPTKPGRPKLAKAA
jgi:hypothetical protein